MKPLSKISQIELEIETLFAGARWTFVAIPTQHGAELGITIEGMPGVRPIPPSFCHADTLTEMLAHAAELNAKRGHAELTTIDGQMLAQAVRQGKIRPEDYPGKANQAFRLLIRSLRLEAPALWS